MVVQKDDSIKALVLKCVTMVGGGLKNCPKLRDVICGRLLILNVPDVVEASFRRRKGELRTARASRWHQRRKFRPTFSTDSFRPFVKIRSDPIGVKSYVRRNVNWSKIRESFFAMLQKKRFLVCGNTLWCKSSFNGVFEYVQSKCQRKKETEEGRLTLIVQIATLTKHFFCPNRLYMCCREYVQR